MTFLRAVTSAGSEFSLALNKEKPTKKDIQSVICKVSKWKTAAGKLQDKTHQERIAKTEDDLKSLMAGLGAKVKGEVKNHSTSLPIMSFPQTE